jgi:predicted pyridoxine 5'-phosphate oxidase superfamily flavin-nucleotide-binding protein
MARALKGWHAGEISLQRQLGYEEAVSDRWTYVESIMREQHRIFHTSNLPFIPLTTLDDHGRPWGSIMAGAAGEIGFVTSPDDQTLVMNVRLWDGEPFLSSTKAWLDPNKRHKAVMERFLIAGIGIEFPTRRRNKFAGRVVRVDARTEWEYEVTFRVTQALG